MAATTASRAPPESLTLHARSRVLELAWPGGAVHRLPFELLRVCSQIGGRESVPFGLRRIQTPTVALSGAEHLQTK